MESPDYLNVVVGLVDDWVRLIQAVIWPFTFVVVLLAFRREIPRLVEGLGRRVSRVSVASVSLELAVATEIPNQIWQSLRDLQETTAVPQVPDSGSSLFRLIQGGERADYVRIDLGEGDRWITSRLFIFALVPFQLLQIRSLVFLETRGGVAGRFAGLASPDAIREGLGRSFPWLEAAWLPTQLNFSSVTVETQTAFIEVIKANSTPGPLQFWQLTGGFQPIIQQAYKPVSVSDPQVAEMLARNWLSDPSIYHEIPATNPQTEGWLRLGPSKFNASNVREERAAWIRSGADLDDMTHRALTHAYVTESGSITRDELYRESVLQWDGDFVAVVDGDGRFKRLLDRDSIVARLASDQAQRQQSST